MWCISLYIYADIPEDFDWAAYLMEGISLATYNDLDDEVAITNVYVRVCVHLCVCCVCAHVCVRTSVLLCAYMHVCVSVF